MKTKITFDIDEDEGSGRIMEGDQILASLTKIDENQWVLYPISKSPRDNPQEMLDTVKLFVKGDIKLASKNQ